jgi:hypothetical protein
MKDEPKSKVVTFRLSEKEYMCLKAACGMDARSVSAIARNTVMAWAETVSSRPGLDKRLTEIYGRAEFMER